MVEFSKEIKSNFPNNRVKALLNIKFTAHYFDALVAKMLKPYHISEQQYNILQILRGAKKAISVNEVKNRMIQKSPNTTRLMDKLCDKNLIERVRCTNDRRVVFVKINNKGLELLDRINIDHFSGFLKNISEDEAKVLNELLDKLRVS